MANRHPDEKELYERIRNEKITVPPIIWDLMYRYLGDDISAITQITSAYHRYGRELPVNDAKKILEHTEKIRVTIGRILHYNKIENENEKIEDLKNFNTPLHPVINELFFHYIGNDVLGIDMIVGSFVQCKDPDPIPVDMAKKILDKTATMKLFLDRLREATNQEVTV